MTIFKTFKSFLTESSLGRIFQHSTNKEIPFALLTAFRGDKTEKENIKNNKELATKIKKAGYGYFFVDDYWIENEGTDKEGKVSETSIFVVGNKNDSGKLKSLLIKWMKTYNQDAVLYRPEGTKGGEATLLYQSGKQEVLGKLTFGKVGSAYTKLRGKAGTFIFEGTSDGTNNWISKIAEKKK